jgi:hypothetical protein
MLLRLLVVKGKETMKDSWTYNHNHKNRQSARHGEVVNLILAVSCYGLCCDAPLNQGAGSKTSHQQSPRFFPTPPWHGVLAKSPDDCPHGFPVRSESCMARMVLQYGGMGQPKVKGPSMPSGKVAPIGHHQRQQISTIQLLGSWTSLTIRLVARSRPTSAKTVSGRSFYPRQRVMTLKTSICQPTFLMGDDLHATAELESTEDKSRDRRCHEYLGPSASAWCVCLFN